MVKLTEVINILQTYVEGAVPHNIHKVEHIIWNQEEEEKKENRRTSFQKWKLIKNSLLPTS